MLKLYDFIRRAIFCDVEGKGEWLEGEVEMDESYFGGKRKGKRGRGAEGKIPVFGILERDEEGKELLIELRINGYRTLLQADPRIRVSMDILKLKEELEKMGV